MVFHPLTWLFPFTCVPVLCKWLCFADCCNPAVPGSHRVYVDCSVTCAAPCIQNSLPYYVRASNTKTTLKLYLFYHSILFFATPTVMLFYYMHNISGALHVLSCILVSWCTLLLLIIINSLRFYYFHMVIKIPEIQKLLKTCSEYKCSMY